MDNRYSDLRQEPTKRANFLRCRQEFVIYHSDLKIREDL